MRTIRFRHTEVRFPDSCAVCLAYPRRQVSFERTFIYGRASLNLRLQVPLCSLHAGQALAVSPAQRWCRRLSVAAAFLLFLLTMVLLLLYWASTRQGSPALNIPLALVVGSGMGLTLWSAAHFWLEPLLAYPASRAVRASVRMLRFDPRRGLLDIRFQNDIFAELTARQNLSILDTNQRDLKRYFLHAVIHSDDIRLNGSLDSEVLLDHAPSEAEARDLLEPPAQAVMARNLGEGCFYDVIVTEIREL